jgi:hypothetical protein
MCVFTKKKEHTYNQWLKKGISREELSKILSDMSKPGVKELGVPELTPKKKPTVYKRCMMHPIFQHPYILLKKKEKFWLCGLITSEEDCRKLEPCSSRFFDDGFFTRTMFTTVEPIGRFMYPFENMRQVNLVLKIIGLLNKSLFLNRLFSY